MINDKIVQAALEDEGKEEFKGNHGWKDKGFDAQMEATGWQDGQAWCAYWTEKVWCQCYDPQTVSVLKRLFSANAVATFNNFWDSNFVTSDEPVEGAVVIWQKMTDGRPSFVGHTQWIRGHAGLVISTEGDTESFMTLEGNSNSEGGREGIEVARQTRGCTHSDRNKQDGLRLLGFIHPKEI